MSETSLPTTHQLLSEAKQRIATLEADLDKTLIELANRKRELAAWHEAVIARLGPEAGPTPERFLVRFDQFKAHIDRHRDQHRAEALSVSEQLEAALKVAMAKDAEAAEMDRQLNAMRVEYQQSKRDHAKNFVETTAILEQKDAEIARLKGIGPIQKQLDATLTRAEMAEGANNVLRRQVAVLVDIQSIVGNTDGSFVETRDKVQVALNAMVEIEVLREALAKYRVWLQESFDSWDKPKAKSFTPVDVGAWAFEKAMEEFDQRLAALSGSKRLSDLEAENARLKAELNTPETADFLEGVRREAAHQRVRWGSAHDAGKTPADWFWLIGYLAGKALHFPEKRLHHCISTAAALLNWHLQESGKTNMRPGINPGGEKSP